MGRKATAETRRVPTQARARETYDAIVRASADVLREEGYDATTTAKIAARAGVGKGALYQYFSNKEEIVARLVEVEFDRLMAETEDATRARLGAPPLETARALLEMNVTFWLEHRDLLAVLLGEVPGAFQLPGVRDLEQRFALFAASLAEMIPVESRPPALERKLYVLTNSVAGLLFRIALADPPDATPAELVDELMALLIGYLRESGLAALIPDDGV